jgi:hypothetical protein
MGVRGIGFHETNTIAATGTVELLAAAGKGYQECGLTGKTSATATGLSTTTQYYLKVAINGGTSTEYDITTAADVTYAAVIALLNAAVSGVTFALINGDLRCTSNSTDKGSAIALAAGTTGTDLFATLTDFSAFDTAVKPLGGAYALTSIDVLISSPADTGVLSLSDGTTVWFGPWLCKDGNGCHVSMKWHPSDPFMLPAGKPFQLICATANVGARCTVKGYCP